MGEVKKPACSVRLPWRWQRSLTTGVLSGTPAFSRPSFRNRFTMTGWTAACAQPSGCYVPKTKKKVVKNQHHAAESMSFSLHANGFSRTKQASFYLWNSTALHIGISSSWISMMSSCFWSSQTNPAPRVWIFIMCPFEMAKVTSN